MITLIKWFFGIIGFLVVLPFLILFLTAGYLIITNADYRAVMVQTYTEARECARIGDVTLVRECVSLVQERSMTKLEGSL